jgi:hypothetical protein
MFKNKKLDNMLVEEHQYRAVITYMPEKFAWKASVQRRVGINEWVKVRCGLKGAQFSNKEIAESTARNRIKVQKSLDDKINNPISYIIYDD